MKTDNKNALKCEIEIMEKEIPYLTGNRKVKAKEKYMHLLRSCRKGCGLEESIYLRRK